MQSLLKADFKERLKEGKKEEKEVLVRKDVAIAICSVVGVMIVAAGGFYLWGMNSYKDRFLGNTYITASRSAERPRRKPISS